MLAIAASLLLLAACGRGATAPADADEAIRAVDAAYVEGWLQEDARAQERAVLALFTQDASVMPADGAPARAGIDDIRAFWFPKDAPPTIVTRFIHDIGGVDAEDDVGAVHGRYELSFTYEGADYSQSGTYLMVMRKAGAEWRISRMIWNSGV
jgi:uncharacterized protein (TIGR02246 family)